MVIFNQRATLDRLQSSTALLDRCAASAPQLRCRAVVRNSDNRPIGRIFDHLPAELVWSRRQIIVRWYGKA